MIFLGYGILALALTAAAINAALNWGDRRATRWARVTDDEVGG